MNNIFWQNIKDRLRLDLPVLIAFVRNPIAGMQKIPDWDWPLLLILQGGLAAACGLLSGIVARSFTNMIAGIIVLPVSSIVLTGLATGFFYYTFAIFFKQRVAFKRLYLNLVFANAPLHVLLIAEPVLPLATMIGLAITSLLLVVGFIDNFQLPKPKVIRLMGALFTMYLVIWVANSIRMGKEQEAFRGKATPESMDILEKEFPKEQ